MNDILGLTNSPRKPVMPTIFYVDERLENLEGTNNINGTSLSKDNLLAHGYSAVSAVDSIRITMAHELSHLLGLAIGPTHEWVGMLSHYPESARHFLMNPVPVIELSPANSSLRFDVRDERWLFEFTPDRRNYETAKSFIKHK